jgi:nitrogen fixation protein FixH
MTELQKKSKIPYFFLALFLVVLLVNIFYIYISQSTWRGVSTQDSYQKGLQYNQVLQAAKKQKNLGWKMKIQLKNLDKEILVLLDLKDKNSRQISNAKVLIEFKRPTQEGVDFTQELKFINGFYQAQIAFPLRGQWDFAVLATKDDDIFQEVKRYVIQ